MQGYDGRLISNGQMVRNIQDLHKLVHFTEKQLLKPETSIKDGKMNLLARNILSGKTVKHYRCSIAPGIFNWNDMENQLFHFLFLTVLLSKPRMRSRAPHIHLQ